MVCASPCVRESEVLSVPLAGPKESGLVSRGPPVPGQDADLIAFLCLLLVRAPLAFNVAMSRGEWPWGAGILLVVQVSAEAYCWSTCEPLWEGEVGARNPQRKNGGSRG